MKQEKTFKSNDGFSYEIERIRRIEDQVKAKPITKDLKEAALVLKDFGIKITVADIPKDIKSIYELEKWKARLIKERLYKEVRN